MDVRLIATKPMTYKTRRLVAGDEFSAREGHARLLIAIKKAERYIAPPKSAVDLLREQMDAAGIEYDKRWGEAKLREALGEAEKAAVKAARAAERASATEKVRKAASEAE